ncbi:MAG TPA: ABC transporter substrate-binding protein [Gemmatimonadales bacterium]
MRRLISIFAAILLLPSCARLDAQARAGTIVIVTGEQATVPVPTLIEGAAGTRANQELADQLFLRLAERKPGRATSDERGYEPQLARSWSRRDSLTLVFDLDPRARWHDGMPVTARDVVFTFQRARDPEIAPSLAALLQHVSDVRAEGDHRVVISFNEVYGEQFFDATYYVQPIPAHLLASLAPDAVQRSPFVQAPVGDGPYHWVRSVPGETVELAAETNFFLGRPGLGRVIFRTASDPAARMNLLLSGEADAMASVVPPMSNRARLERTGDFRLVTTPSDLLGYLLFNYRNPADTSRPHPVLADARVRQAVSLALDRHAMALSQFGPYSVVPYGPVSQMLWLGNVSPKAARQNVTRARSLLRDAGWRDSDGDGTLDRGGKPLSISLIIPSSSIMRRDMGVMAQEQLRQVGVRLDLLVLERPVWQERFVSGRFDLAFGAMRQVPSPSALTDSWTCRGANNVSHYCDPAVDSLLASAVLTQGNAAPLFVDALGRLEQDAPASFLYAPLEVIAVHKRYQDVELRDGSPWLMLWRWHVRRGQQLPRDRIVTP